jgi:hypothetical protein
LELQEKKRELANQAIEGSAKVGAGKLGMREMLQLFHRDAERAPPVLGDATSYTGHVAPRILAGGSGSASGQSSREGTESARGSRESSVIYTGERRATPPVKSGKSREDPTFGRRW